MDAWMWDSALGGRLSNDTAVPGLLCLSLALSVDGVKDDVGPDQNVGVLHRGSGAWWEMARRLGIAISGVMRGDKAGLRRGQLYAGD